MTHLTQYINCVLKKCNSQEIALFQITLLVRVIVRLSQTHTCLTNTLKYPNCNSIESTIIKSDMLKPRYIFERVYLFLSYSLSLMLLFFPGKMISPLIQKPSQLMNIIRLQNSLINLQSRQCLGIFFQMSNYQTRFVSKVLVTLQPWSFITTLMKW